MAMSDDRPDPIIIAASRVEELTVSEAARSPTGAHLLPDRREDTPETTLDEFDD
jgi:hypothetical protein